MNEDLYSLQKIKFTYMNLIDSHQSSLQTAFTYLYKGSDQNLGKTISSGSNKVSRTIFTFIFPLMFVHCTILAETRPEEKFLPREHCNLVVKYTNHTSVSEEN